MSIRILLLVAGAGVALWAFRRWRLAIQIAMVLLIFEGAIRKWLFPGAQDLIYFAKDVLLLAAYAGFLTRRRQTQVDWLPSAPLLYGTIALSVLFGLLEIFNPNLPNLLVGILGFKAYFFYVPLLFIVPATLPSDAALARFLRRYLLISIPVGALAMAQFFSPASSILNTYARSETDYVVTFGSSTFVRVTATFSFISGYAAYLIVTAFLLLAVLGMTGWRFRGNLKTYLALGMTVLGMFMTGSRGPIVVLAALFPVYWRLAVGREKQRGATAGRIIVGVAILAALVSVTGSAAIGAFQERVAGSGQEIVDRALAPWTAPFRALEAIDLFGFGIGSTHQTAAAVTPGLVPYSWLRGMVHEAESVRVMIELGPLGFFLVYATRVALVVFAFRQVLRLRTRFHRSLAVACFLFFLASLPGGVVFDVTSGVYYWFLAGLLMLIVRLDRQTVPAMAPSAPGAPAVRARPRVPGPAGERLPVPHHLRSVERLRP